MRREMIFKDTQTGEALVLPVTPKDYEFEHGRKPNSLTMHEVGDINVAGSQVLLDREIECMFPAQVYPFALPAATLNPFYYVEKFTRWSDAGTVLRLIAAGTPINEAVILGPIRYREQDGTNDVYCTVPVRGYHYLAAATAEVVPTDGGNAVRTVEAAPEKQSEYTVQRGDTLSAIAKKFYGDAGLYQRLAAENGIANPNLIHVGQVLRLPAADKLPPAPKSKPRSQRVAEATKTYPPSPTDPSDPDGKKWDIWLAKKETAHGELGT